MFPKSVWLNLAMVFTATGAVLSFAGCSSEVTLKGKEDSLAAKKITVGGNQVIYPDAQPSIPDGKGTYQKLQCAQCHSDTGTPVSGKTSVNFSDVTWARHQKPVDEFEFVYFGKPGVEHPALSGSTQVTRNEVWNLVFYVRSLAFPYLSDKEISGLDAVFGSNCAVCHGKKGYGDGPLSKNMEPMPANFQNKTRFFDRSDDVLWDHIANGIRWEGMPNFLGKEDKAKDVKFDQDYIWKLVKYVRHFHETNESTSLVAGKDATTAK